MYKNTRISHKRKICVCVNQHQEKQRSEDKEKRRGSQPTPRK